MKTIDPIQKNQRSRSGKTNIQIRKTQVQIHESQLKTNIQSQPSGPPEIIAEH